MGKEKVRVERDWGEWGDGWKWEEIKILSIY